MATTITYERLAAQRPANTNEAELYEVPADTMINAVLRICNQDSSARTYRVAHTDTDGAAADEDFVVYDKPIAANDTHEITISAKNGEWVRIKASVADKISFVLEGQKMVTS